MRTYSELKQLTTFGERYEYLRTSGKVGEDTFGFDRYLNQMFYRSNEWKEARRLVIIRDLGCDLGCEDRPIFDRIVIHHMNPISVDQIRHGDTDILNPEYLICCSDKTHKAIHYGAEDPTPIYSVRTANDTCPWKK